VVLKFCKVKRFLGLSAGVICLLLLTASFSWAVDDRQPPGDKQVEISEIQAEESLNDPGDNAGEEEDWEEEDWEEEWEDSATIADPLEPLNRFFFHLNDKLYFWVLKPVATVYSGFFPEELQIAFRNFFDNLRTPARAVNSLLQGNVRDSSEEVARFALNSTLGIVGIGDFAEDVLGLRSSYEALGQTLAHYGAGGGFYINWPFLGPSNFRDSLGMLGDAYLHPIILLDAEWDVIIGAWAFEKVNYTALTLGDYELFTETALDPYAAVKDAYQQYRNGLIENR
jgi:phospholipid-binding lipoprotein MlaA